MMAPVKDGVQQRSQNQQSRAQPDHAIGHIGGKTMFHDQRDHACDYQQHGQTAEPVMAMAMAVVFMVALMMVCVRVVAAMPVASAPAIVVVGFIEREFIAHPNIKFAHSISLFTAGFGR
jgi:hypothetical protein